MLRSCEGVGFMFVVVVMAVVSDRLIYKCT